MGTPQVLVNGVDVTSLYIHGSMRIRNTGAQGIRTADLDFVDLPGTAAINLEHTLRFLDGGVEKFEGKIKARNRMAIPDPGPNPKKVYRVTAQDYTHLLTQDVIDATLVRTGSRTDKAEVEFLITTYTSKGITVGSTVQNTGTISRDIDYSGMNLYEALEEAGKWMGTAFYVDGNLVLHWFVNEANAAPFNFHDVPNNTTTFGYRNLRLKEDSYDLINAVWVIGTGIAGWRTDAASIAAYGRIETTLRDSKVTTAAQLNAAGDGFLADHANPLSALTLETFKDGLAAGMTIQLTNALWGISAVTYQVMEVTTKTNDPSNQLMYEVSLDSRPLQLADVLDGTRRQVTAAATIAGLAESGFATLPIDLSVAGDNLVKNSSFESGSAPDWTVGSQWVFGFSVADAYHAAKVARVVPTGTNTGELVTTDYIPVAKSDFYWFSFWSFLRARSAGTFKVAVREYSAANALLATTTFSISAVQTEWTRHQQRFGPNNQATQTVIWNASTAKVKVAIFADGSPNGTWDVDGLQLERGSILTAYSPRAQELVDLQITATQIADDAVTTPKLIANAVVAGKIATDAVTSNTIAANAVTTAKLDAGAVTAAKVAAGAISGGKLDIGQTLLDNLIPDAGWEWQQAGSGPWEIGSAWAIGATAASTTNKNGRYRLLMTTAGVTTTQSRTGYIPINGTSVGPYLTYAVQHGITYTSGTVQMTWWAYDDTKTLISNGILSTFAGAAAWPVLQVFRLKPNGKADPATGETIDVTLPANTAYVRFGFDDNGSATSLTWFITALGLYAGLFPFLSTGSSQAFDNADQGVTIDRHGIIIYNGRILMRDEFFQTVIAAGGFSGPWVDFIALGLYNARFLAGTNGSLPAGRTDSLPYWTLAYVSTGLLTKLAAGAIRASFTSLSSSSEALSDVVPVRPGTWYSVSGIRAANVAAGVPRTDIYIKWYDDTLTQIGGDAFVGRDEPVASVSQSEYVWGLVKAPSTAVYAKVEITFAWQSTHNASNTYTLYTAAFTAEPQPALTDVDDQTKHGSSTALTTTASMVIQLTLAADRTYMVSYGMDFGGTATGYGEGRGELYLDGSLVSAAPALTYGSASTGRILVSATWPVAIAAGAAGTLQLRGRKTVAGGTLSAEANTFLVAKAIK